VELHELIKVLLEPNESNLLFSKDKNQYYLLEEFIDDIQKAYSQTALDETDDKKILQIIELLIKIADDTSLIPYYYNGITVWKDKHKNIISDSNTFFEKYIESSDYWKSVLKIAETIEFQK